MSRIGHVKRIETFKAWLEDRKKNGYVIKSKPKNIESSDSISNHIISTKLRKK